VNALASLRRYALWEGASLVALVVVAMPLKHVYGRPAAVRVVGGVHGLLFLLFVAALVRATIELGWGPRRYLTALGASLVPGGTFWLDRALRRELRGGAVAVADHDGGVARSSFQ
jgi:integral membrane protein